MRGRTTTRRAGARRTREARRPRLSAEEARTFGAQSLAAYQRALLALAERNAEAGDRFAECDCDPYADLFTFARWRAQGLAVQRGEHGIKHLCWIAADGAPEEAPAADQPDTKRARLLPKTTTLFCRCQVAPVALQPAHITTGVRV